MSIDASIDTAEAEAAARILSSLHEVVTRFKDDLRAHDISVQELAAISSATIMHGFASRCQLELSFLAVELEKARTHWLEA